MKSIRFDYTILHQGIYIFLFITQLSLGFFFQRNTFQLVLITDGTHAFALYNYNKITWAKSSQV